MTFQSKSDIRQIMHYGHFAAASGVDAQHLKQAQVQINHLAADIYASNHQLYAQSLIQARTVMQTGSPVIAVSLGTSAQMVAAVQDQTLATCYSFNQAQALQASKKQHIARDAHSMYKSDRTPLSTAEVEKLRAQESVQQHTTNGKLDTEVQVSIRGPRNGG